MSKRARYAAEFVRPRCSKNGCDYDAVKLYGGAKPGDASFADIVAVDGEIYDVLEGAPVSFTDTQLEAIFIAAAALPLSEHGPFLVRVAAGASLQSRTDRRCVRDAIIAVVSSWRSPMTISRNPTRSRRLMFTTSIFCCCACANTTAPRRAMTSRQISRKAARLATQRRRTVRESRQHKRRDGTNTP
jgi:hypothetical protein